MIGRGRFNAQHVECSARQTFFGEHFFQCGFIDDMTARGVDQISRRFHQAQCGFIEQVACFVGERAVDRDDIGLAQQFFEADQLDVVRQAFGAGVGIVGEDLHAQRVGFLCQRATDAANADDAEGLYLMAHHRHHLTDIPDPLFNLGIGLKDLARQAEHQCQGVIGDFVHAVIRDVADDDAPFGCCFQINGVDTDAITGHDPAVFEFADDPAAQGRVLDDQPFGIGALRDDFVFRPAFQPG